MHRMIMGVSYIFSFFFNLVEKNLLRNFLSVAKMASLVYERENCSGVNPQTIPIVHSALKRKSVTDFLHVVSFGVFESVNLRKQCQERLHVSNTARE